MKTIVLKAGLFSLVMTSLAWAQVSVPDAQPEPGEWIEYINDSQNLESWGDDLHVTLRKVSDNQIEVVFSNPEQVMYIQVINGQAFINKYRLDDYQKLTHHERVQKALAWQFSRFCSDQGVKQFIARMIPAASLGKSYIEVPASAVTMDLQDLTHRTLGPEYDRNSELDYHVYNYSFVAHTVCEY